MEGKLCEVSEEVIKMCGDVLWNFLHRTWAIPFMKNDVVQRLLHRSSYG